MPSTGLSELDIELTKIAEYLERPGMYFIPESVSCCLAFVNGCMSYFSDESVEELRERCAARRADLAHFGFAAWLLRESFSSDVERWNFLNPVNNITDKAGIMEIRSCIKSLIVAK